MSLLKQSHCQLTIVSDLYFLFVNTSTKQEFIRCLVFVILSVCPLCFFLFFGRIIQKLYLGFWLGAWEYICFEGRLLILLVLFWSLSVFDPVSRNKTSEDIQHSCHFTVLVALCWNFFLQILLTCKRCWWLANARTCWIFLSGEVFQNR